MTSTPESDRRRREGSSSVLPSVLFGFVPLLAGVYLEHIKVSAAVDLTASTVALLFSYFLVNSFVSTWRKVRRMSDSLLHVRRVRTRLADETESLFAETRARELRLLGERSSAAGAIDEEGEEKEAEGRRRTNVGGGDEDSERGEDSPFVGEGLVTSLELALAQLRNVEEEVGKSATHLGSLQAGLARAAAFMPLVIGAGIALLMVMRENFGVSTPLDQIPPKLLISVILLLTAWACLDTRESVNELLETELTDRVGRLERDAVRLIRMALESGGVQQPSSSEHQLPSSPSSLSLALGPSSLLGGVEASETLESSTVRTQTELRKFRRVLRETALANRDEINAMSEQLAAFLHRQSTRDADQLNKEEMRLRREAEAKKKARRFCTIL